MSIIDIECIILPFLSPPGRQRVSAANVWNTSERIQNSSPILKLYQLRQKVWTLFTRLGNMVIEVGTIILAIAMLKGPSLLDLSVEKLAGTPIAEAADVLTKVMSFVPGMVLVIVIVIASIEVAQTFYRLLKSRPSLPYPVAK